MNKPDIDNTLRDMFAMSALPCVARILGDTTPEELAAAAYALAEAMIQERLKRVPRAEGGEGA